jgi:hypothetical protein
MTRETRNAEIQALYREVNERIASLSAQWRAESLELLCECGAAVCSERVEMTRQEYERTRAQPTHFVLRHGHQDPHVEDVVHATDTFLVVANYGDAATVARRTDPRANGR